MELEETETETETETEMETEKETEVIEQGGVGGSGGCGGDGGCGELFERLPQALLLDILSILDVNSLYAAASVCRAFRSSVSQVLSILSILDLSGFTPSKHILNRVMNDCGYLRSLTIDCSWLDDTSIKLFANKRLEELVLLKCYHFSSYLFLGIGQSFSNLRVLSLELICGDEPNFVYNSNKTIEKMFKGCLHLESLSLKFGTINSINGEFNIVPVPLPKTIKTLLLQPVSNRKAMELVLNTQLGIDESLPVEIVVHNSIFKQSCLMVQTLTLVVEYISDELVITITKCLHYLTDLCLEDNPPRKPSLCNDLSNSGLQVLSSCRKLTRLSLSRNRPNVFGRITDVGVLVLAEGCKSLESVKLGGFSKVTDAGYISILQSFKNLKKIEIINGCFLSDLAFHDIGSASKSLLEVVLISCNLLTSETAEMLSSCKNLEVLNLGGCRSIANHGLKSISELHNLTSLDLSGADITDSGLSALGLCSSPINALRLRGCKRIGDRGFKKLLRPDGAIARSLSTLDLGYLPGVSDETIARIAKTCRAISSLCIRHCFSLTDASIMSLGLMEDMEGRKRSIKLLDLYNCSGLSTGSFKLFYHPYFRGLRWLGFGNTKLPDDGMGRIEEIWKEKPLLNMCVYGCEMGCKDGWFFH